MIDPPENELRRIKRMTWVFEEPNLQCLSNSFRQMDSRLRSVNGLVVGRVDAEMGFNCSLIFVVDWTTGERLAIECSAGDGDTRLGKGDCCGTRRD